MQTRMLPLVTGVFIIIGSVFWLAGCSTGGTVPLTTPAPIAAPPSLQPTTPAPTYTPAPAPAPAPAVTPASSLSAYTVRPGTSIQSVLNSMPPGEICNIEPGIYIEALTIPRSDLTLRKSGAGEVVIDGGGAANAILIDNKSNTTIEGLVIKNSAGSLIKITGPGASHNTVKQCTLLEWGLDGKSPYSGAVDSADGAAYTTVDSSYIDRGNHEAVWTQNPEAISYHLSGGHHTITNNIIWGVCRDGEGNPIKVQNDFGDGYPLYKFNLFDGMCGEDGIDRLDFDGTLISGNHLYGAHDDMIGVQALDRDCTISNNYIDSMGGAVGIVLRGASIGPVNIYNNIIINSGIAGFKYASWEVGNGMAVKYINRNTYYSTLSRSYTQSGLEWYIPILDTSYNRFIDGEVNEADYDNLNVDNNYVLSKSFFVSLMPGSGTNNAFTNNHFSTSSDKVTARLFGQTMDFSTFNSYASATNVWEVISRPSEPPPPRAGAR